MARFRFDLLLEPSPVTRSATARQFQRRLRLLGYHSRGRWCHGLVFILTSIKQRSVKVVLHDYFEQHGSKGRAGQPAQGCSLSDTFDRGLWQSNDELPLMDIRRGAPSNLPPTMRAGRLLERLRVAGRDASSAKSRFVHRAGRLPIFGTLPAPKAYSNLRAFDPQCAQRASNCLGNLRRTQTSINKALDLGKRVGEKFIGSRHPEILQQKNLTLSDLPALPFSEA
jgi:hypothetical protein